MNEFTIGQYIDKYRDVMWSLWDDDSHASGGSLMVDAGDATTISWIPSCISPPTQGSLTLAIEHGDHIAVYHVSRHGGQSLIKNYIGI